MNLVVELDIDCGSDTIVCVSMGMMSSQQHVTTVLCVC